MVFWSLRKCVRCLSLWFVNEFEFSCECIFPQFSVKQTTIDCVTNITKICWKLCWKKKTQFSNIRERESEREGKTTIQWKTSIWFETNSLWSRRCLINLSWFCFSPHFCLFIWFICFYVEFRFFFRISYDFLMFSFL